MDHNHNGYAQTVGMENNQQNQVGILQQQHQVQRTHQSDNLYRPKAAEGGGNNDYIFGHQYGLVDDDSSPSTSVMDHNHNGYAQTVGMENNQQNQVGMQQQQQVKSTHQSDNLYRPKAAERGGNNDYIFDQQFGLVDDSSPSTSVMDHNDHNGYAQTVGMENNQQNQEEDLYNSWLQW